MSDASPAARRGLLLILSSPSGAGKTTLAKKLLAEFPAIGFSISYTTRPPRPAETHGVDYLFVSPGEFERMAAAGDLAEWAQVHGNYYGTARAPVEAALQSGRDILFDIDWQGARDLSRAWPDDTLSVFVLPPDWATLAARLRGRGSDSEAVIERRLANALAEIEHWGEYQEVLINDDLERAYRTLRAMYLVRRYRLRPPDAPADAPLPDAINELTSLLAEHRAGRPERRAELLLAQSRSTG
jgi:guanylate kinase